MSNLRWLIALAAASALAAFGGYRWAYHDVSGSGRTTATANPATQSGKVPSGTVLYWHDPMKPEFRFDKPGKSPYMDMQLVPVYASGGAASAEVAVSPNMQQSLGIRMGRVQSGVMTPSIAATGTVAYDEHRTTVLQARAAGFITRLHVKAAQDRVRQGQALAELTVPAWVEAEGEYLALLNTESAASTVLRGAARERLLLLGMPEAAVAVLEQARKTRPSTTIYSPIDGVITELGLREGASFAEGALLFRINGLATVWVNAQVPEAQAGILPSASTVEIRAPAWPGKRFAGHVEALLPQLDPVTRTLTARIVVDNQGGKLTPGMFVSAVFRSPAGAPQLWVPSEAVIVTGQRSVVIRARTDGAFEAADVTIGSESAGKTTIVSGLREGERVVLSGQFLIDSEASLKSAVNRLSAGPSPAPEPTP